MQLKNTNLAINFKKRKVLEVYIICDIIKAIGGDKMQSFLELCNEVQRKNIKINVSNIKPYIEILQEMVRKKREEQPQKTIEQLKKEIIQEMKEEIYNYTKKNQKMHMCWIEGNIIDKFLHNPHHLKEVLEEVKVEKEEGKSKDIVCFDSQFNEKRDEKNFINKIYTVIEMEAGTLNTQKGELNEENSEKLLEMYSQIAQKQKRELYVKSILENLRILKKYDFIKGYCERYNSNMQKIGLEGIQLTKEEFDKKFQEEKLKKLPLQELASLDVFYQNRFAKEQKDLCDAIYFMNQLDLWDPENKREYHEKTFQKIYVKKRILDRVKREMEKEQKGEEEVIRQYEKDYNQCFQKRFQKTSELRNINNDFAKEWKEFQEVQEMTKRIYQNKYLGVGELIQELSKNTKMNWGYVPQDPEKEKNTILLAFDIKGYNLPLCVHVPKKKFVLWFKDIKRHELPIYQGNEDFKIGKDMLPINVFYPLSEKDIKEIANRCKQAKKKPGSYLYPDCMIHIAGIAIGAKKNKKETILVEDIMKKEKSEDLEETR